MQMKTFYILFLGVLLINAKKIQNPDALFPYEEEPEDICDKDVLLNIEDYINHFTFREFHNNIQIQNIFQPTNMITSFQTHFEAVQNYLKQLKQIKEADIKEPNLTTSSQSFVIIKMFKIVKEIVQSMGAQERSPAFPPTHQSYGQKNLSFFMNKLGYIFNKDEVNYMTQVRGFVDNHVKLDNQAVGNYYFDQQYCQLLNLIVPVVNFYLQKDSKGYVIDKIQPEKKELLEQFFVEYFKVGRKNLSCAENEFMRSFLLIFLIPREVDLVLQTEENDLERFNNKKFKDDIVKHGETPALNIYTMDRNFIDIHRYIYSLTLKTIRQYKEHPHHFSMEFIKFLDRNLYLRIRQSIVTRLDGTNGEEEKDNGAYRLTKLIYKLYIYARLINHIPKTFTTEPIPILKKLLEIIMDRNKFKKGTPEEEFDPELDQVNTTKQDIRNDFLPLINILNDDLPEFGVLPGTKEDEPTYIDQHFPEIYPILKDWGQITDINNLLDTHPNIPEKQKKNIVKQTITGKLMDIDDEIVKKLNRKKDNDKTESESDEYEDEIEMLKNAVTQTKTVKGHPPVKETDNDLVIQMVDKLEANENDPEKEIQWRKFILKFLMKVGKEGQINDSLWLNINTRLFTILKQRIHSVDGFFRLIEWALSRKTTFFPEFPNRFELENKEEEKAYEDYLIQVNNQKYVFNVDNVLFAILAKEKKSKKKMEELEESQKAHTTQWFAKMGEISYNDFFENKILRSPLFFDRFRSFEFFFEVVDVFTLFDNLTVTSAEEQDRYGEIFLNMYRFILDVREGIDAAALKDPMEFVLMILDECIEYTFGREEPSRFDEDNRYCTQSYRNYMEITWFLKYFNYAKNEEDMNDPTSIEAFWEIVKKDEEIEEDKLFLVETSPFIIFMNKMNDNSMHILCEEHTEEQICLEYTMFQTAVANLSSSSYNFEKFNQVVFKTRQRELKGRKYILWNVLEAIHRYDKITFQKFLVSFDRNDKNNDKTLDFIKFLEIEKKDEDWFARYMKFNFAYYSLSNKSLETAIDYVFETRQLKKFLFDVHEFNYHGASDEHQIFHFRNIGLFLYFAHTTENYRQLAEYIKKQGWLVLLFKNGEFNSHDKLLYMSQKVRWINLKYDGPEGDSEEDQKREQIKKENAQLNSQLLFTFLESQKPAPALKVPGIQIIKQEKPKTSKDIERQKKLNERLNKKKGTKPVGGDKNQTQTKKEISDEAEDLFLTSDQMKQKLDVRVTMNNRTSGSTVDVPKNQRLTIKLLNSKDDVNIDVDDFFGSGEHIERFMGSQLINRVEEQEEETVMVQEIVHMVQVDDNKSINKDKLLKDLRAKYSNQESTKENEQLNQMLKQYTDSTNKVTVTIHEVNVQEQPNKKNGQLI